MKNTLEVIFVALFIVLGFSPAAFSQGKDLTYADIFKMEQTAMTLLRSTPYRSTWTSWNFPERGKEPSYRGVFTYEIDATGRTRSVQENHTPGSFNRMEGIFIGDKNYRKFDDGPWRVYPLPPSPLPITDTTPPTNSKPRFENSVKLIETLNNNDGLVSVYETISKATREENGKDIVRISTNRFWFRYDGRLLRKDMELETIGEPRILKNSMVYEYENIKIEEPIVK